MSSAKRKDRAPFQRPQRASGDEAGRVVVAIQLRDGQGNTKGNMSRAITVRDAKVSEVAAVIEHALFGDIPTHKATRAVESRGVAGGAPRYHGADETQGERESA